MPTSATRATSPFWYIFGNNGRFAVGGEMTTYSATNPTLLKPTYADPACINANPTTLGLDALGQPQGWPEIYWADDEKYRVIIHCDDGTEYVIDNFPYDDSGGGGGSVVGIDNDNKLLDGQFRFWFEPSIVPTAEEMQIAQFWRFKKNNVSATDRIEFNRFNLGQDNPEATPVYYFRYVCTGAGTGESYKDLYQQMADVRTFEQTPLTFSFDAYSDVPRTVELIFIQHFGGGVGASPDVTKNLASIDLPSGIWQKQSVTFTPDSVAGKSLGSNGGDHISIIVRFPLDSVCDIGLTNMDIKLGDRLLPYQRLTKEQEDSYLLGAMIPDIEEGDHGKAITANKRRAYDLMFPVLPGMLMPYMGDTVPSGYEDEWALAHDQTVSLSESGGRFKRLFDVLKHKQWRGYDAWTAISSGENVGISTLMPESIMAPSNGTPSPGFTFVQYAQGNPSLGNFDVFRKGDLAQLSISCRGDGYASAIGDTGALAGYTTAFSGNQKRRAEFVASFKAANAMTAGTYFTIHTPLVNFAVYYTIDNIGVAPSLPDYTNLHVALTAANTAHDVMLKTINALAGYQVDYINCQAASAIPPGSYIVLNTYNRGGYYFWFKIGGSGADPKVGGRTGVMVTLASGDTAVQVAQKLADVIDSEFFRLPDLRGMIIKGLDPSHVSDFDFRVGGNTPGSIQFDQVNEHNHGYSQPRYDHLINSNESTTTFNQLWSGVTNGQLLTDSNLDINNGGTLYAGQGGYETRPVNYGANYLIKL